MPVVGMGGYFFRARDPEALTAWYRDRLGVGGGMGADEDGNTNDYVWYHEGGPMVFSPFKADSDYFAADKQTMINLRVRDMEGLLASLKAAGVEIVSDEDTEIGRFARIHDPEANAIELWEPRPAKAAP